MLEMEVYNNIKEYEDIYQVSNFGNIKSLRTNKILNQHIGVNGYKTVALRKNSNDVKPKIYLVHRLLALTFIENKNNYPAEKQLKIAIGNISKCINGKLKTAGGYIWQLNN